MTNTLNPVGDIAIVGHQDRFIAYISWSAKCYQTVIQRLSSIQLCSVNSYTNKENITKIISSENYVEM